MRMRTYIYDTDDSTIDTVIVTLSRTATAIMTMTIVIFAYHRGSLLVTETCSSKGSHRNARLRLRVPLRLRAVPLKADGEEELVHHAVAEEGLVPASHLTQPRSGHPVWLEFGNPCMLLVIIAG